MNFPGWRIPELKSNPRIFAGRRRRKSSDSRLPQGGDNGEAGGVDAGEEPAEEAEDGGPSQRAEEECHVAPSKDEV